MPHQTFERLLSGLSDRFANFHTDQIASEIGAALRQLIEFLGVDRTSFAEVIAEGLLNVLYSAAVEGIEPFPCGSVPSFLSWYVRAARRGKIIVLRSAEDLPPEATGEAEYFRRSGLRSQIGIPLSVGGKIIGGIGFCSFSKAQAWPDDLILRLKLLGEVFALALARKRVAAELTAALQEIALLKKNKAYLLSKDVICSRFGLTATEARVALAIANGEALASMAKLHGVTIATVRTQLKSVFSKVGAHRQAELGSLLGVSSTFLG